MWNLVSLISWLGYSEEHWKQKIKWRISYWCSGEEAGHAHFVWFFRKWKKMYFILSYNVSTLNVLKHPQQWELYIDNNSTIFHPPPPTKLFLLRSILFHIFQSQEAATRKKTWTFLVFPFLLFSSTHAYLIFVQVKG